MLYNDMLKELGNEIVSGKKIRLFVLLNNDLDGLGCSVIIKLLKQQFKNIATCISFRNKDEVNIDELLHVGEEIDYYIIIGKTIFEKDMKIFKEENMKVFYIDNREENVSMNGYPNVYVNTIFKSNYTNLLMYLLYHTNSKIANYLLHVDKLIYFTDLIVVCKQYEYLKKGENYSMHCNRMMLYDAENLLIVFNADKLYHKKNSICNNLYGKTISSILTDNLIKGLGILTSRQIEHAKKYLESNK